MLVHTTAHVRSSQPQCQATAPNTSHHPARFKVGMESQRCLCAGGSTPSTASPSQDFRRVVDGRSQVRIGARPCLLLLGWLLLQREWTPSKKGSSHTHGRAMLRRLGDLCAKLLFLSSFVRDGLSPLPPSAVQGEYASLPCPCWPVSALGVACHHLGGATKCCGEAR